MNWNEERPSCKWIVHCSRLCEVTLSAGVNCWLPWTGKLPGKCVFMSSASVSWLEVVKSPSGFVIKPDSLSGAQTESYALWLTVVHRQYLPDSPLSNTDHSLIFTLKGAPAVSARPVLQSFFSASMRLRWVEITPFTASNTNKWPQCK